MSRIRSLALLFLWTAALVAAIFGLRALGNGSLAIPAGSVEAWRSWLAQTDIGTVVFALLREISLVAAWYLLIVSVLSAMAETLQLRPLSAVAQVITPAAIRRLTAGVAGASLAGALLLPSLAMAADAVGNSSAVAAADAVPVMKHLTNPANPANPANDVTTTVTAAPTTTTTAAAFFPTTTTTFAPQPTTTTTTTAPAASAAADGNSVTVESAPLPSSAVGSAGSTWTVRSGDNLWSIAQAHLETAWQRPASNAELVPYWKTLVNTNRTVLANPDNPDLVFPGQILNLPATPNA